MGFYYLQCNSSLSPLLFLKPCGVYLTFYLRFLIVTVEFYILHFLQENVYSILNKDISMLPCPWEAHAATQEIFDKQVPHKCKQPTLQFITWNKSGKQTCFNSTLSHLDLASEVSDFCTVDAIKTLFGTKSLVLPFQTIFKTKKN